MATHTAQPALESVAHDHHHLVCWKSVAAGVLITIMSYMILTALGAGIAGMSASSHIANEENATGLASLAGVWLGISAVISLFLGSYFTLRISRFVTNKVGAAHGFVVASIFFVLMVMAAGSGLGSIASGIGSAVKGVGNGSADLAQSPMVQDVFNNAIGTDKLKDSPREVVNGLAIRFGQGDVQSAKNYFAYETGMSASEVDAKFSEMQAKFEAAAKTVGEKTAQVVAAAGWSLFVTFLVGLAAALIGGRVGAHANVDRPLAAARLERNQRPVLANA